MNNLLLILCTFIFPLTVSAADIELLPFQTGNQSPLVQIYGIPRDTGADIVPSGMLKINLNQDLSSNYTVNKNTQEQITLDGEMYRMTIAARYGIGDQWETGIELPYIVTGGGFLDSFVIAWHNTFGLPQGGRDSAPKNRLNYAYHKDATQKLRINHATSGFGDLSLTGGFRLYDDYGTDHHDRLAIKAALKLPTGDSSYLLGSGSTDFMFQISGSSTNFTEFGSLGFYGSLGALAMSTGDILRDQHNPLAGVGTFGIGWSPASWISFKLQLNGTTPFYHGSSLDEISQSSLLLTSGGSLSLPGGYLLDIGVGEDLAVATASDVSFHLGLSKSF